MTTEALETLEALGSTLNFNYIWLKRLKENYNARRVSYIITMKDMFNKIPLTMIKALTQKQKKSRNL